MARVKKLYGVTGTFGKRRKLVNGAVYRKKSDATMIKKSVKNKSGYGKNTRIKSFKSNSEISKYGGKRVM